MKNSLKCEGDADYKLRKNEHSVWITVGNFSVYVLRQEDGHVDVEILPRGDENSTAPEGAVATSSVYVEAGNG